MKMDWRDKPRPSAPIGVNLRELALSEATAVATSRSPRRASRGMLTAYESRQPRRGGIWEFFRQKTTFDPCSTPCERGQMPPLRGSSIFPVAFYPTAGSPWANMTSPALRALGRLQSLS